MSPLFRAICFTLFLATTTHAKTCYTPAGDDRNAQFNLPDDSLYAPCDNSDGTESMCCAIGPSRGLIPDTCRPDGLCNNAEGSAIYRESCTDPTWQSPACVKLFLNGTGFQGGEQLKDGQLPLSDVLVTFCPDGSFCYGIDNQACCQEGQGVFVNAQGEQTNERPETTTTSSTTLPASTGITTTTITTIVATTTTTSTTAMATTATNPATAISPSASPSSAPSSPNTGLSIVATAAIAAGVVAAILLAAAVVFFFVLKQKRQSQPPSTRSQRPESGYYGLDAKSANQHRYYEMEDRVPPPLHEMEHKPGNVYHSIKSHLHARQAAELP